MQMTFRVITKAKPGLSHSFQHVLHGMQSTGDKSNIQYRESGWPQVLTSFDWLRRWTLLRQYRFGADLGAGGVNRAFCDVSVSPETL